MFNNARNNRHGKEIDVQVVDNLMTIRTAVSDQANPGEGAMRRGAFWWKKSSDLEEAKLEVLMKKAVS